MVEGLPTLCSSLFRAFRIGELVSKFKTDTSALALGDLCWNELGLCIRVRISKTDHLSPGHELHQQYPPPPQPMWYPAGLLATAHSLIMLFTHTDGSPLIQFQFTSMLCRAATTIGIPPRHFALHSFRIGTAATAAITGMTEGKSRTIDHCRSKAFRGYIQP